MARDEFNIDEAEDFDDGTRAVLHTEGSDSDGGNEAQDATRLRSSRKQRLQAERQGGKQREQASALRVKNWDAGLMESAEYAGKVVTRKDLQEDEAMDSPDEDAMADWSDAEPFEPRTRRTRLRRRRRVRRRTATMRTRAPRC